MVQLNEALWRPLYTSPDPIQARAVATSIAAMWFEVHLTDHLGRPVQTEDTDRDIDEYVVRVLDTDFAELLDVLDEILDEQMTFDAMLDARTDRLTQSQQRLLVALIVVVSALAATGAIDL